MKETTRRQFLKQFGGPTGEVVIAWGCPAFAASGGKGGCTACFLATLPPVRTGRYDIKGTLFSNLITDLGPEVRAWLEDPVHGRAAAIVGELQDGLAFEGAYKARFGASPGEILVPLFSDPAVNRHGRDLVFLSKFTKTQFIEAFGPQEHVVLSWSLTTPHIERDNHGVAPLSERLETAARLRARGWRVRFRIDQLYASPGVERELEEIVENVNAARPEMVTLGEFRASRPTALRRFYEERGHSMERFDALRERDPSGFKARIALEDQLHLYRGILSRLDPKVAVGLCKEDRSLWKALGLKWRGCECLQGEGDQVVARHPTVHFQTDKVPVLGQSPRKEKSP